MSFQFLSKILANLAHSMVNKNTTLSKKKKEYNIVKYIFGSILWPFQKITLVN